MIRGETIQVGPGAVIGPLGDLDGVGELTAHLGVHNSADRLVQRHRQNWPLGLTEALSREKDFDRSRTLDLGEVEAALRALKGRTAFFKADDVLEDASVRGTTDKDRIVSVVFRKPSGRSANGVIPYAGMPKSVAAHAELMVRRDAEERLRLGLRPAAG